jgi:hypothetical protein
MRPTTFVSVLGAGLLATLSSGCGMEVGASGANGDEEVTQRQSAVIGVDQFAYFRSNATGWGVDESTRLFPFVAPNLFSRIFNVTEPWMVSDVDTATVTVTNQLDGWGTSQTFYRASAGVLQVPPGGSPIAATSPSTDPHFKIHYSALGVYRVTTFFTNPVQQAILIESQATACAGVCPPGLTCSLLPPAGIPTCNEPPPTGP